jgi:hypothetical protein
MGKPKRELVQLRRISALVIPLQARVGVFYCLDLLAMKMVSRTYTLGRRARIGFKASRTDGVGFGGQEFRMS